MYLWSTFICTCIMLLQLHGSSSPSDWYCQGHDVGPSFSGTGRHKAASKLLFGADSVHELKIDTCALCMVEAEAADCRAGHR